MSKLKSALKDVVLIAIAFLIGYYLLTFVTYIILEVSYEWSHASFRLFFNFFNAIGIFPDYPLDPGKQDYMVSWAAFFAEAIVAFVLYKWLKRKYFKK